MYCERYDQQVQARHRAHTHTHTRIRNSDSLAHDGKSDSDSDSLDISFHFTIIDPQKGINTNQPVKLHYTPKKCVCSTEFHFYFKSRAEMTRNGKFPGEYHIHVLCYTLYIAFASKKKNTKERMNSEIMTIIRSN